MEILVYDPKTDFRKEPFEGQKGKVREAKKIVIKSGTSTITKDAGIDKGVMVHLAEQIADLYRDGRKLAYVSSGAIGFGMLAAGLNKRPKDVRLLQALSTRGQIDLMYHYKVYFEIYNQPIHQVLLSEDSLDGENLQRVREVFERIYQNGGLPIINANDATWAYEIEESDNDWLAAMVARHILDADLLVLLTDVDGLMCDDRKIDLVYGIDDKIRGLASQGISKYGSGGMLSKIKIGEIYGKDFIIANGKAKRTLSDIFEGKNVGTYFSVISNNNP